MVLILSALIDWDLKQKRKDLSIYEITETIVPTLQAKEKEGINFLYDKVTSLSMSNDDVKGISSLENSLERSELKKYDKGCILEVSIDNQNEYAVAIGDVKLIIEEIKAVPRAKPVVLGYMYNNQLIVYMINDGKGDFNGEVQMCFKYFDDKDDSEEFLDSSIVEAIIPSSFYSSQEELMAGDISRIAKYDVSCTELQKWMSEHRNNSDIYIMAKVIDNNTGLEYEYKLGYLYAASSTRACLKRNQSQEYELPVENPVIFDIGNEESRNYKINMNQNIDKKATGDIHIVILPTESCEITFHAVVEVAGEKNITTANYKEEISVPLYKNGGQDQYSSVLEYLIRHDIDKYRYGQDETIQENIAYKPDIMVKGINVISSGNGKERLSEDICYDFRIGFNPTWWPETGEQLDVSYIDSPPLDYESHGLYGEVLNQYYETAKKKFEWWAIENACYVNKGASNYYNHNDCSVHFQYIDLAEDGVSELVIAIDEKEDPMNIVDIFTLVDDELIRVIENDESVGYRNRYYICSNKMIKNIGSGGALNSQAEYFELLPNSSKLNPVDLYIHNGWDGDYYSHTEYTGREAEISWEHMDNIMDNSDGDFAGKWMLLYKTIKE